jgi:HSP20 family protein
MNIEKLKPWNWFKHENQQETQIPIVKDDIKSRNNCQSGNVFLGPQTGSSSLLRLHQEMNLLFEGVWRSFGQMSPLSLDKRLSLLANGLFNNPLLGDYRANMDVSGNDKEYEILIDLPRISASDVQVEITDNILTIRGKKEESSESEGKQYYRIERSFGSFQRTLSVPDDANTDEISACLKDGVLTLNVPRKSYPTVDVKRIAISSN